MFRRLSPYRLYRLTLAVLVAGSLPFLTLTLIRLFQATVHSPSTSLEDLKPLEMFYLKPNYSNEVVNPHPFNLLLDPGDSLCSRGDVYLLVYVHSAPQHALRRAVIRRTWGNVTQFDVPVRVVFVMGVPGDNSTDEDQIRSESDEHKDIVQEDFTDTYHNITHKAVAALRWVVTNCPQATFVLKADDDAFVNMFHLLRLLTGMTKARAPIQPRTIMCNLWEDSVPRKGKWALERSVFRFESYPIFCQGLAFIMSRDLVAPLYNATFYTPFLRMDDVYLTGFAILRVEGVMQVEMNSYYVKHSKLWRLIRNDSMMDYVFSHLQNPNDIPRLWTAIQTNSWDPWNYVKKFSWLKPLFFKSAHAEN